MAIRKVDNFLLSPGNKVKQTAKNLPQVHELRALGIRCNGTIRSTAVGAFNIVGKPNNGLAVGGTNDLQLALSKFITGNCYLKRDGVENAYALKPVDMTIVYGGQHRRCMVNSDLIDGDVVPGSGAAVRSFSIDVLFDWTHSGFGEFGPNKFTCGTEQALLGGGWEVAFDEGATAGLAGVVFSGGTANLTFDSAHLIADVEPVDFPIVGTLWTADYDVENGLVAERTGAAIELLVYEQNLAPTLDGLVTSLFVKNDGTIEEVNDVAPSALAAHYQRTQKGLDGLRPFAVERNCSPLRWVKSQVGPEERELAVTIGRRAITFQGSTAQRQMVRHRILAFKDQAAAACDAVLNQYPAAKAKYGNWQKLPIRFPGRDPLIDQIFGTRVLAM